MRSLVLLHPELRGDDVIIRQDHQMVKSLEILGTKALPVPVSK